MSSFAPRSESTGNIRKKEKRDPYIKLRSRPTSDLGQSPLAWAADDLWREFGLGGYNLPYVR